MVELNSEIRKLRPSEMYSLAKALSPSSWKSLLGIAPNLDKQSATLFTSDHLRMIECAAEKQNRLAAEIFLEEWSTMGRRRPTIKILMDLLIKAELFRAADFLAIDVLQGELPKRPDTGPAAPIPIPNLNEDFNLNVIDKNDLQNIQYPFNVFSDQSSEGNINHSVIENNDDIKTVSSLIKFSSSVNDDDKFIKQSHSELLIPNLTMLNIENNIDEILNSKELPVCIQSKFQEELAESVHPECSTISLSSSSSSSSLEVSNSIDETAELPPTSPEFNVNPLETVLKSEDLPLPVLEETTRL